MTLLIIKEVTENSITKYRLYYYYWIWILLLLFLLFFWRLNPVCIVFTVIKYSYTSLGQCIKSKSRATLDKININQLVNLISVAAKLTPECGM